MNSVDRTFLIGARAIDLMKTYCVTAAPRSYEVWYAFVTGLKPNLNRAIDAIVERHTKLTSGDVAALYEAHFEGDRLIMAAARTGGELVDEVRQVGDLLTLSLTASEAYGDSLQSIVDEGGGELDRAGMRDMLASLLTATREVSQTNRALAQRFAQSRDEILKLRQSLDVVRREALTDPLTGIANRRLLDSALREARETALATAAPLSLILIDVDEFKRFNDRFGHPTGDQVLRLVAAAMGANVGADATLARYGGEEFVILMPGVANAQAHVVAERVRANVAARELVKRRNGESLGHVTVSLGVVTLSGEESVSSFLGRADRCLYAAKRAGRNRTVTELDQDYVTAA